MCSQPKAQERFSPQGFLTTGRCSKYIWTVVLFACTVLLTGCDKTKGIETVEALCARDGGERIFDTVYVDGYFYESSSSDDCLDCRYALGTHGFEYVDLPVRGDARFGRRLGLAPGYYRYSLSKRGDSRCEVWNRLARAQELIKEAGVSEAECIAVSPLPSKPEGYSYRQTLRALMVDELPILVNEWSVQDTSSGTVLATIRDYQFTSKLTQMLDMSGHGGNADATCLDIGSYARSVTTLPTRVLRDPSKRISE
jgi:hypothetical protein